MKNITTLTSAPGWFALYKNEKSESIYLPLACWAVNQENKIDGMVATNGEVILAKSSSLSFCNYIHESDLKKNQ